jgi:solute carrier family 8 (sodium/calcium exchanger)
MSAFAQNAATQRARAGARAQLLGARPPPFLRALRPQLQFALVPPSSWGQGWPAFAVSLAFIGIWTAVVGELASLFGCVVGLGDAITAITFVALGTSLPDTFASRLATLHDEHADAAIGNITGSNSVNVFLGLGIPWIIGSLYHRYSPTGKGVYSVPAGSLAFSVMLFSVLATCAIVTLMARRAVTGAELGGSRWSSRLLSVFFALLWVIYIILAALNDKGFVGASY